MAIRSQSLTSKSSQAVEPDPLVPQWAKDTADWLVSQHPAWRAVGLMMGLIITVVGALFVLGGGYTSIQGIRVPLAAAGVAVDPTVFPAPPWWLLPGFNNFVQIFAKRIPGLRSFWFPSVCYDSTTTAVFVAFGIAALLAHTDSAVVFPLGTLLVAVVAALTGLFVTIQSERITIGSIFIVVATLRGR